jgi:ADP-ribose pyrophosphatase
MAVRVAKEDSGCVMTDVEKILNFYPSPSGCSEYVALYWGRVSTIGVGRFHGVAEEGENIRVFSETTDEALRKITTGKINSSIAIIGVQWLALNRQKLRRRFT